MRDVSTVMVSKTLLDKIRQVSYRDRAPSSRIVEEAITMYLEKYPDEGMIKFENLPRRGRPAKKDSLTVAFEQVIN